MCVSLDYDETFIQCAKVEGYLTEITIIALRNITKRKTESLYPLVNSATNVTTRTLNRVFHSSSVLKDTSMKIMWTYCSIQPNILEELELDSKPLLPFHR